MRAAAQRVTTVTSDDGPDARFRTVCNDTVMWVFLGGDRPPQEKLTDFVRQTATEAVEHGFRHAYGDAHRGEIDPKVIARLASLAH